MSRLTNKDDDNVYRISGFTTIDELIDKLAIYEDLEEQIGCPLEVVFKVLKQNYIYTKSGKHPNIELGTYGLEWCICYGLRVQIRTADYKKTWWLKEDKSE